MLKSTLLSAILIATSAASSLVIRHDSGVIAISPGAFQEVANAITAFADDVNAVSSALIALKTEIDSDVIAAIATNGLSAESDEDSQRQVLLRFAGDAGNKANELIMEFTPMFLMVFRQ